MSAPETKRCLSCKKRKLIKNFGRDRREKDGYKSRCRDCRSFMCGYRKTCSGCGKRKKNRNFPKKGFCADVFLSYCLVCVQKYPTYHATAQQRCSSCGEKKLLACFHRDKRNQNGRVFRCKACRSTCVVKNPSMPSHKRSSH